MLSGAYSTIPRDICQVVFSSHLVQLGANNCTVIVGFNAQLLKYFAVLYPPSVWYDRQIILTQLVSYLSREILVTLRNESNAA
jgi:hypothetical protein